MIARAGRGGSGNRYRLAGIVTSRQERTSQKGNRFAFLAMSDTTGSYEITVFSELLAVHREIMNAGQALVLTVEVQKTGDELRLTCQGIEVLEKAIANAAAGLRIVLASGAGVVALRDTLAREPKGKGQVSVIVRDSAREVEMRLPGAWAISPKGRAAIEAMTGILETAEI